MVFLDSILRDSDPGIKEGSMYSTGERRLGAAISSQQQQLSTSVEEPVRPNKEWEVLCKDVDTRT